MPRLLTGIAELDRVLGGGLVPGSLVLLGGSPGIGKSPSPGWRSATSAPPDDSVLYVSGEESAAQVRLRAERLGEAALAVPALAETSLEAVLATLEAERPDACVIDSVQTLHAEGMSGAPGSVGQVREAASAMMGLAKRLGCAVILVGHVTKEGAVAGPRVLEHLVDCVLFFEGERERSFRTLRALKNRFGATSEVGVFEMRSGGLIEVARPLGALRRRGERRRRARACSARWRAPGRCWSRCRRWSRRPRSCPRGGSRPGSTATGWRWCSRFSPATAGRRWPPPTCSSTSPAECASTSPGADLAVALALASAHRGEPLAAADGRPLACFGEVGLTGELRSVGHAERRVAEALKFGLGPVLGPAAAERLDGLRPVATLRDALRSHHPAASGGPPTAERPAASATPLDNRKSDLSTRN